MRNKLELTQRLIELLPAGAWTVDQARITWWYNFRESGGMRLTKYGYDAFVQELDLEFYKFEIPTPEKFTQRTILALDRQLQMPYYMARDKGLYRNLIFFGSKEAVLVNLYGNLEKFLDNYR